MNIIYLFIYFFFFFGGGGGGGHHKIGLNLGVISMHFRDLSFGQGTELDYIFWGLRKFKYFLGGA